jgi:hypothetical protein
MVEGPVDKKVSCEMKTIGSEVVLGAAGADTFANRVSDLISSSRGRVVPQSRRPARGAG